MGVLRDTIFALSSAPGRSGVAVVRLTGAQAVEILKKITNAPIPAPRRMVVRRLYSGADLVDEAMVVWFEKGASYTAEEMVELHLHGGKATVAGALAMLGEIADLRHAEPGEFTRRAMDAGRMDLVEVEALADQTHTGGRLNVYNAMEHLMAKCEEVEIPELEIAIAPNPASETVRIRPGLPETIPYTLRIMNSIGKVVYTEAIDPNQSFTPFHEIGVKQWQKGLYVVSVEYNGKRMSQKFVIMQ